MRSASKNLNSIQCGWVRDGKAPSDLESTHYILWGEKQRTFAWTRAFALTEFTQINWQHHENSLTCIIASNRLEQQLKSNQQHLVKNEFIFFWFSVAAGAAGKSRYVDTIQSNETRYTQWMPTICWFAWQYRIVVHYGKRLLAATWLNARPMRQYTICNQM